MKVTATGHTAHTNHYLDSALDGCNIKVSASSATRFRRISELLQQTTTPLSVATFATMSKDRNDGPNDSLWRTGSGSRTLSSWILELPAEGAPRLRVVLAHPRQPEKEQLLVLDQSFWTRNG